MKSLIRPKLEQWISSPQLSFRALISPTNKNVLRISTRCSDFEKIALKMQEYPDERVIPSPYPEVQIPEMSYPQFALKQMNKFGQKIFLVNGETGAQYTYHESLREVSRVASALLRLGVKRGDRMAFYSFNRPEYVLAWFAATSIGAVATDANPNFTADELQNQLKMTNSKYLFAHVLNAQRAKCATSSLPAFKRVFVFGEAPGCIPYTQLAKDSGDLFRGPVEADPSHIVHLPCSSGTTGPPKAAMRSHTQALATAFVTDCDEIRVCEEQDTCLVLLPLFHIFGNSLIGNTLLVGSSIVTNEKFSPQETLVYLQNYKVSVFPVVPSLVQFLVHHPLVAKYDLSRLQSLLCGGASIFPEVLERAAHKLAIKTVRQGYGATEMGPISFRAKNDSSFSSIGKPVCNSEIKVICTESECILDVGESGEILARGPQMVSGYENNSKANATTLVDGWFRTGDVGYVNSGGHLHIIDRLKDIIKVKGHQVAPSELEALLLTHPGVKEAAVIGVPDHIAGEVPRAFVVLSNFGTKIEELKKFVAERTCPEKHLLGGIIVLEEIPKSPSGKVLKKDLKQLRD